MIPPALDRRASGGLYALRLAPGAATTGLQGEIEHVVTGERCRFQSSAELLAWLQGRHAAATADQPGNGLGGDASPRRATT